MIRWLREKRIASNLSQKEVANRALISQQYYNFIENGKRHPPVETAKKIAEVLGFDWTQFYVDDSEQNAS